MVILATKGLTIFCLNNILLPFCGPPVWSFWGNNPQRVSFLEFCNSYCTTQPKQPFQYLNTHRIQYFDAMLNHSLGILPYPYMYIMDPYAFHAFSRCHYLMHILFHNIKSSHQQIALAKPYSQSRNSHSRMMCSNGLFSAST